LFGDRSGGGTEEYRPPAAGLWCGRRSPASAEARGTVPR
jgi:hypothetical protein